jgi:NosR/NirI family nitrous oxide reductase transcriptional regulator
MLCSTAVVATAAQRPRGRRSREYVNPEPELELKQLFPAAAAFSPLAGTPPHVTAYRTNPQSDPGARPIGFAFWTTDLVPNERGYHGPIRILVGMDPAGILAGVVVDSDTEPYGYFSVEPPQFAAQFKGKSIRDSFKVGSDIDAVSRATISVTTVSRSVRNTSRRVARQLLTAEPAK